MKSCYKHVQSHVERVLDGRRLSHTFGVVQTAVVLARIHGVQADQVALAAVIHDCAKPLNSGQLQEVLRENPRYESQEDAAFPHILHGPAAAILASREMGVSDPEVLEAVAYHPTGKSGASPVLLVLMAADYCEPTRDFPGVEAIRRLVRGDLEAGVVAVLENKIGHVRRRGGRVHPRALEMLGELRK